MHRDAPEDVTCSKFLVFLSLSACSNHPYKHAYRGSSCQPLVDKHASSWLLSDPLITQILLVALVIEAAAAVLQYDKAIFPGVSSQGRRHGDLWVQYGRRAARERCRRATTNGSQSSGSVVNQGFLDHDLVVVCTVFLVPIGPYCWRSEGPIDEPTERATSANGVWSMSKSQLCADQTVLFTYTRR